MKLNLRAGIAAAAGSIANTAGVMIQADVQRQRDERLFNQQAQVRETEHIQASQMAGAKRMSDAAALEEQRAYDEQIAQVEHSRTLEIENAKNENRFALEKFKGQVNPSGTNVSVSTGQDLDARTEEFSKAVGKTDAALYEKTRTAASSAVQMEDSLHVLEEMQKNFKTGKTQEALAILGQYANTDAAAAMQAWEGTISPIVLSKAEGLSGVLSDKDMEFLKASVPTFGRDEKANSIMIGLMRKGMERAIENEKSMQEHINKHGNLNNWTAPNKQGTNVNASESSRSNIGNADDPLGLFD